MIVLDTDVVSEPFRVRPDSSAISWLAQQRDVAVTAVTVGELFVGARRLPLGRRRETLMTKIEAFLGDHRLRVLPYDGRAAVELAVLWERRRAAGRPLGSQDGMIAAIARVHRAALATRNVADFEDLGLDVTNPWLP